MNPRAIMTNVGNHVSEGAANAQRVLQPRQSMLAKAAAAGVIVATALVAAVRIRRAAVPDTSLLELDH